MEVEHTPAKTTAAQTVYQLTRAEVICALDYYVRLHRPSVPYGKLAVWFKRDHDRRGCLATLVVDHDEPKSGPEEVF